MNKRIPPDTMANLCRLNRRHTSFQWPVDPMSAPVSVLVFSIVSVLTSASPLPVPDARVETGQQDVGDQGADDRQDAQDQQKAPGQIHVLALQCAQQYRAGRRQAE